MRELRKTLFRRLCHFVDQIAANSFVYVIDRAAYAAQAGDARPPWASTPWLTGAITITMLGTATNQGSQNNKGLTVLIFDDNKRELPALSEFLIESCEDVDDYYERSKKADPFDHIVDTAFAIRSEHSHLVQISDACAYAVRRRAEIELGASAEAWAGEHEFILDACAGFKDRICFPSRTWTGTPQCAAVDWIRRVGLHEFKPWLRG